MKRFLAISFIALALGMGAAGAFAPAAHADPAGSQSNEQYGAAPMDTSQRATDAAIAAGSAAFANPTTPAATTGTDIPTPVNPNLDSQFGPVMHSIMTLFAWLVGVAAITLDNAVYYTVITMGNYINSLSAIGITWSIGRDIGNIVLIFGFMMAGIATIISYDMYGWTSKMLPNLLIAAILLNFSLFITEAVIDTGNLFATQFYTQINGGKPAGAKNFDIASVTNDGIANKIMAQLGMQNIYGEAIRNGEILKASNSWVIGFMGILLFLVTAFVLFSLAFILIARFVILVYVIILSPVAFAGWVTPKLQYLSSEWSNKLINETLTAPILLLLLYIALRVITDVRFLTGFCIPSSGSSNTACVQNWTGFVSGNLTGFASMILSFLVAMGLLLIVIMAAKRMSAFGASWATNMGGKLSFGAAAFVGRRSAGRLSNYAASRIRASALGRTETGRLLAGVADRGAKATYDIRGTKTFGSVAKSMSFDAGQPPKGGYKGTHDALVKARVDYAKTLKQTDKEKEDSKKYQANIEELQANEHAQTEATRELIDESKDNLRTKRQAMEEARKSGSRLDFEEREDEYKRAKEAHGELVKAERIKLDPIRKSIKEEKEKLASVSASPQKSYAQALRAKTFLPGVPRAPYDWTTAVGGARKEAAGKIGGKADADAKKSEYAKRAEKVEEMLEKEETPPPAPSGGAGA